MTSRMAAWVISGTSSGEDRRRSKLSVPALALLALSCVFGTSSAVPIAQAAPKTATPIVVARQANVLLSGPMSEWVERSRGDFTAFMPPSWLMTASQNGTDISSATGIAVASFAYATEDPAPSTDAAVLNFILQSLGFSGVRLLRQTRPYSYASSVRQVTELTGYVSGTARHAIVSVEVFNYYAEDSFGFDANLEMAQAAWWPRYKETLGLIADHIYFFGHVPAELAPGHCGLDPADTSNC
jgi:hypothetical protein